jgi:hypothetical protein
MSDVYTDIDDQIFGVPDSLVNYQIENESSGNPLAQSSTSSAFGLGQFLNTTSLEQDPEDFISGLDGDPYSQMNTVGQYDTSLLGSFGSSNGTYSGLLNAYSGGASYANGYSNLDDVFGGLAANDPAVQNPSLLTDIPGSVASALGNPATPLGEGAQATTGILAALTSYVPSAITIIVGIVMLLGALFLFRDSTPTQVVTQAKNAVSG